MALLVPRIHRQFLTIRPRLLEMSGHGRATGRREVRRETGSRGPKVKGGSCILILAIQSRKGHIGVIQILKGISGITSPAKGGGGTGSDE